MPQDLTLVEGPPGRYSLGPPTEVQSQRLSGRFLVQFLSLRRQGRGSSLYSAVRAAQVKTNSDVVGLSGLAAAEIRQTLSRFYRDLNLLRVDLQGFDFGDGREINMRIGLVGTAGSSAELTITVGDDDD